jgi:hypothetical protein
MQFTIKNSEHLSSRSFERRWRIPRYKELMEAAKSLACEQKQITPVYNTSNCSCISDFKVSDPIQPQ